MPRSCRFETVDAAEKCIQSLRRFRNLHPMFSKVSEIENWLSFLFVFYEKLSIDPTNVSLLSLLHPITTLLYSHSHSHPFLYLSLFPHLTAITQNPGMPYTQAQPHPSDSSDSLSLIWTLDENGSNLGVGLGSRSASTAVGFSDVSFPDPFGLFIFL